MGKEKRGDRPLGFSTAPNDPCALPTTAGGMEGPYDGGMGETSETRRSGSDRTGGPH